MSKFISEGWKDALAAMDILTFTGGFVIGVVVLMAVAFSYVGR